MKYRRGKTLEQSALEQAMAKGVPVWVEWVYVKTEVYIAHTYRQTEEGWEMACSRGRELRPGVVVQRFQGVVSWSGEMGETLTCYEAIPVVSRV